MLLTPFDEQDTTTLHHLGFTIRVTRNGEMAVITGEMKIEMHRSGEDKLTLIIGLPNGREIVVAVPRKILLEPIDLDD